MSKQLERLTVLRLGGQVERHARTTRRGRRIWQPVAAGATFAGLFPDLMGQTMSFGRGAVELVGQPRLMAAALWLIENGYL